LKILSLGDFFVIVGRVQKIFIDSRDKETV